MDDLVGFLSRLKRGDVALPADEAKTRNAVVLPVLRRLGWDIENTDEVIPEYSTRSRSVDFCLCCGKEKVFLEVKKPAEDLDKHEEQLLEYAFLEAIDLAVLTNGRTWSFYLPRRRAPVSERKVWTVDLLREEPADSAPVLGTLLAKETVQAGKAPGAAELLLKGKEREEVVRLALEKAWAQLLLRPDERLVELLDEAVEKLSGSRAEPQAVTAFLRSTVASPAPPPPTPRVGRRPARRPDEYTGRKPKAFTFRGARVDVHTWVELLVQLARLVSTMHKAEFSRCLKLRGTKVAYFSKDAPDPTMYVPRQIPGTRFYVETCWPANDVVRRCHELLDLFGYKPRDLRIETNRP